MYWYHHIIDIATDIGKSEIQREFFSQLLAIEASLGLPQVEVYFLILRTRSGISPKSSFTVTTVFDSPYQDPKDT